MLDDQQGCGVFKQFIMSVWGCYGYIYKDNTLHEGKKFEGGPLKAMAMKNIITCGYTNSVRSTLLQGGSGGILPQENFEKKML